MTLLVMVVGRREVGRGALYRAAAGCRERDPRVWPFTAGGAPSRAPAIESRSETRHDKRVKIGILTSGGDCPGLNAVIRGAVLKGLTQHDDVEFVGIKNGWKGLVEADVYPLGRPPVMGSSKQGG